MLKTEHIAIIGAALLVLILIGIRVAYNISDFNREYQIVKMEMKRSVGKNEKKYWKRKKRKMLFGFITKDLFR